MIAWGIVSSSQRERERERQIEMFHEELRQRMEERKNQIRPKQFSRLNQSRLFVPAQKSGAVPIARLG
jgi:hypothetical protein